jgi:hypothetical protein
MSYEYSSEKNAMRRLRVAQDLAAKLELGSEPTAVLRSFNLNPDGSLEETTKAELAAMQKREGYSLYEEIIADLDTKYVRTNFAAGLRRLGTLITPYLLARMPNAYELHRINMMGIRRNVAAIADYTFIEAIVVQAPTERITRIGQWPLHPKAIIIE